MASESAIRHGFRILSHFAGARAPSSPARRLDQIRGRARDLRTELLAGPKISFLRSFNLVRVPYPTRFALREACTASTPYIHIINRLFIVQFRGHDGALKTLLASPSDVQANSATPFFRRVADRLGQGLRPLLERTLSPTLGSVEDALAELGLAPSQIDYITYDHLHTQDLRRWLGDDAYFPRAKLLVMRQEWESARGLIPPQRDWYCPHGTEGLDQERLVLLDHDVSLGEGIALIRTPGHTEGNHSIVLHSELGLTVTSENGVGPDSYSPAASPIPGLQRYARDTGMEVVLNGNTLEGGLDQYLSMVLEKELAGPSERAPGYANILSSSELSPYWLFPGVRPGAAFGEVTSGQLETSAGSSAT